MNMKHFMLPALFTAFSMAGCTSMQTPGSDLVTRRPVVKIGEAKPATDDYILLLTAGEDYPVHVSVEGGVISKAGSAETTVQLTRDVYIYKHWSSFNGKTWQRGKFDLRIAIGLEPAAGIQKLREDTQRAVLDKAHQDITELHRKVDELLAQHTASEKDRTSYRPAPG